MKKKQSDARRIRRAASRYGVGPVDIWHLPDGTYELVFGPSTCMCERCEMLRRTAEKCDGPPQQRRPINDGHLIAPRTADENAS